MPSRNRKQAKRFVEDVHTTIYNANYTDPRIRELNGIDLNISSQDKELFQRPAPPSATR